MFRSLRDWALRWVPEDPAAAQRDPDLIMWWVRHRVDPVALPARQVVVQFDVAGTTSRRSWLVLQPDGDPELCTTDPNLGADRYLYVEADAAAMYPIARGIRPWSEAIADGSLRVFGEPELVRALPGWFVEGRRAQRQAAPGAAAGGPDGTGLHSPLPRQPIAVR